MRNGLRQLRPGLRFIAINMWCARRLPPVRDVAHPGALSDHWVVRTLRPADLARFESLHNELRPGKALSSWRRFLYRHVGTKLVWVVESPTTGIVGFTMYYFREGGFRQGIIHLAFIGVAAEHRGCGLAGAMHTTSGSYLADSGLNGISMEVDPRNRPSWRLALRQGFRERAPLPNGSVALFRPFRPSG